MASMAQSRCKPSGKAERQVWGQRPGQLSGCLIPSVFVNKTLAILEDKWYNKLVEKISEGRLLS